MAIDNPKYETQIHGPVQGFVEGEGNTVTLIFAGDAQRTVPFLAPPRLEKYFVGRDDLLRDLKERLFAGGILAASALTGLPGVGKTALAIALAYDCEVIGHFQDGVLWAGLGRQPDVLGLLSVWGAALGIPSAEIAHLTDIADRKQAIQAAIGMRRMLLVIDDAWQSEAALAFKLGSPNCAYLLTTRLHEVALNFTDEECVIEVPELSAADGLTLLAWLAPRVLKVEPDEVQALVQAVGGLPLALILMGKYLQKETHTGPTRRLQRALERLRQREERLKIAQPQAPLERQPSLPADVPLSLMAAIGISDEALDEAPRRTLRALSVFPPKPNSFSEEAALAVSGAPADTLDTLSDSGLLEYIESDRYTLHQTIADYARANLADLTPYERMAKFLNAVVQELDQKLRGAEQSTALSSTMLELDNFRAAMDFAKEKQEWKLLGELCVALSPFFHIHGLWPEGIERLRQAEEALRSLGDNALLAELLHRLGGLYQSQGDYSTARNLCTESLQIARELGDKLCIAHSLNNLGVIAENEGAYEEARQLHTESLQIASQLGDKSDIASSLGNLGLIALNQGAYEEAKQLYTESLKIARKLEDKWCIANSLNNLGVIAFNQEAYEEAKRLYTESLKITKELGEKRTIALLLNNLGLIELNQGAHEKARQLLTESLQITRELKHKWGIASSLNNLGDLARHQGTYHEARQLYTESLQIQRELGEKPGIAESLHKFGKLAKAEEDSAQAVLFLLVAARLYDEMKAANSKDAMEVQEALAEIQEEIRTEQFERLRQQADAMSDDEAVELALSWSE